MKKNERWKKSNNILALFTQNIIKYKLIYITLTPIVFLLLLYGLKYILFRYLGFELNIFDWFGQIMGILGFVLSVVLLDSIPFKEEFAEKFQDKNRNRDIGKLLEDIYEDCVTLSDCIELDGEIKNKKNARLLNRNLMVGIKTLQNINKDLINSELENHFNLAYEFNSHTKISWYENNKKAASYSKLLENIIFEMKLIKNQHDSVEFENSLEDIL